MQSDAITNASSPPSPPPPINTSSPVLPRQSRRILHCLRSICLRPASPGHELPSLFLFFVLILGFLFFLLHFLLHDICRCFCRRSILRKRRNGIDSAVLSSFPVVPYDVVRARCGLDCVVCLAEFEGDHEVQPVRVRVRVLTVCGHVFHSDCINIWLKSHVTCPICRLDLQRQPDEALMKALLEAQKLLEKRGKIEEMQGDEVVKGVDLI